MNEEARRLALAALSDGDRAEAQVALSLITAHLLAYFRTTEGERRNAAAALMEADPCSSVFILPGGEWRAEWPPAASAAIIAMWSTPREGSGCSAV